MMPELADWPRGAPTLRQVGPQDADAILPLLTRHFPDVSVERWQRVFQNPATRRAGSAGIVLEYEGEVVGYLGFLLSERRIRGVNEQFANMTSWVVDKDHRGHALGMLIKFLRDWRGTVTNFTASSTVQQILLRSGFVPFRMDERFILPNPRPMAGAWVETDPELIGRLIGEESRQVMLDHPYGECIHVGYGDQQRAGYALLGHVTRRRLPMLRVHHISDRVLFSSLSQLVAWKLFLRHRTIGLTCDERYLQAPPSLLSRTMPQELQGFYRSSALSAADIDTSYSEILLLHTRRRAGA
jgi:hypothetical protein